MEMKTVKVTGMAKVTAGATEVDRCKVEGLDRAI